MSYSFGIPKDMTTAPQEWKSFLWELKYTEKLAVAGISSLNIKDELKVASILP